MIKVIYNNMIIDLCLNTRYLKYLTNQARFIETRKNCANAILGSDNNTVYHLFGTPYNFPENIKTVKIENISEEEYNKLQSTLLLQNSQDKELKKEVDELKKMVSQQNVLIQQLLEKLS